MTRDAYLVGQKKQENDDQPPTSLPFYTMSAQFYDDDSNLSPNVFNESEVKAQSPTDSVFDFDSCSIDLMDVSPSLNQLMDAEELLAADQRDGTNHLEEFDSIISKMDDLQKSTSSNSIVNNAINNIGKNANNNCDFFTNERISPFVYTSSPPNSLFDLLLEPNQHQLSSQFEETKLHENQQPTTTILPLLLKNNNQQKTTLINKQKIKKEVVTNKIIKEEIPDKKYHVSYDDEGFSSADNSADSDDDDYDDDNEEFHLSDSGSLDELIEECKPGKRKKYFWQYNTQSKGPKGKRLCRIVQENDPHLVQEFEDPVFDFATKQSNKLKHQGKIRRGDGNDVTPNPKKLCAIGLELRRLNRRIAEMAPVADSPANIRAKTRKIKNKLASRACRLKKKAQHEANKVKLHGLNTEHKQLMRVLNGIKFQIIQKVKYGQSNSSVSLADQLNDLKRLYLREKIAGNASDFVNSVIGKIQKSTGDVDIDDGVLQKRIRRLLRD